MCPLEFVKLLEASGRGFSGWWGPHSSGLRMCWPEKQGDQDGRSLFPKVFEEEGGPDRLERERSRVEEGWGVEGGMQEGSLRGRGPGPEIWPWRRLSSPGGRNRRAGAFRFFLGNQRTLRAH